MNKAKMCNALERNKLEGVRMSILLLLPPPQRRPPQQPLLVLFQAQARFQILLLFD
jgi:hypothetical protein